SRTAAAAAAPRNVSNLSRAMTACRSAGGCSCRWGHEDLFPLRATASGVSGARCGGRAYPLERRQAAGQPHHDVLSVRLGAAVVARDGAAFRTSWECVYHRADSCKVNFVGGAIANEIQCLRIPKARLETKLDYKLTSGLAG